MANAKTIRIAMVAHENKENELLQKEELIELRKYFPSSFIKIDYLDNPASVDTVIEFLSNEDHDFFLYSEESNYVNSELYAINDRPIQLIRLDKKNCKFYRIKEIRKEINIDESLMKERV